MLSDKQTNTHTHIHIHTHTHTQRPITQTMPQVCAARLLTVVCVCCVDGADGGREDTN